MKKIIKGQSGERVSLYLKHKDYFDARIMNDLRWKKKKAPIAIMYISTDKTLGQVAVEFNLGRERIRQIVAEFLRKVERIYRVNKKELEGIQIIQQKDKEGKFESVYTSQQLADCYLLRERGMTIRRVAFQTGIKSGSVFKIIKIIQSLLLSENDLLPVNPSYQKAVQLIKENHEEAHLVKTQIDKLSEIKETIRKLEQGLRELTVLVTRIDSETTSVTPVVLKTIMDGTDEGYLLSTVKTYLKDSYQDFFSWYQSKHYTGGIYEGEYYYLKSQVDEYLSNKSII